MRFEPSSWRGALRVLALAATLGACGGTDRESDGSQPALRTLELVAGLRDAGGYGDRDGPGVGSLLATPTGVAVDAAGQVLIVNAGNGKLKRLGADGVLQTVYTLPTEPQNAADGTYRRRLIGLNAVTIGADGNYYLGSQQEITSIRPEQANGGDLLARSWVVLQVTPAGRMRLHVDPVQVFGGTPPHGTFISALAFDGDGGLLVANKIRCAIRRVDARGGISTFHVAYMSGPG